MRLYLVSSLTYVSRLFSFGCPSDAGKLFLLALNLLKLMLVSICYDFSNGIKKLNYWQAGHDHIRMTLNLAEMYNNTVKR